MALAIEFVVIAATVFGSFAVAAAHAQGSPILGSNLEQTSVSSSKARPASPGSGPLALPEDLSQLRLQSSDALAMEVFDVPSLSQELTVDDAGDIVVPLLGRVHVAGDTLRQAERRVAALLLERQLVNAPTVGLKLLAFARQPVIVSGEVQNPGRVQLLASRSLIDVLALAGGETSAAGGVVEIRRRYPSGGRFVERVAYATGKDATAATAARVDPGDDVYVQRAGIVFILGAVQRPGGYLMVDGGSLTLPQAIALALGTTSVAANKEVLILRKREGEPIRLTASLKAQENGRSPAIDLRDGDMLYIPTSKIKAALVDSQAILGTAASASIIGALQR